MVEVEDIYKNISLKFIEENSFQNWNWTYILYRSYPNEYKEQYNRAINIRKRYSIIQHRFAARHSLGLGM
jgi:hypothetical protein